MTIGEARAVYRRLRDRALTAHPSEVRYIDGLWDAWDSRLAQMGDQTVSPRAIAKWLTESAENCDDDLLLEWLDVYPDGISFEGKAA